jgi:hypothetical protein
MLSPKYYWEFIRRNKDYVFDWEQYFKNPQKKDLERLLLKWGFLSFPESQDLNLRWEEVPRSEEDGFSDLWLETKEILQAMKAVLPKIVKDIASSSFSHIVLTGAKDERRLDVPWDEAKGIYFFQDQHGRIRRAFYLTDYVEKKITQLSKKNIPDEINLKIENLNAFVRMDVSGRRAFIKDLQNKIENELKKWGDVAEEMGLPKKPFRIVNQNLLNDYLDVWDRFEKGESKEDIARAKWPDEYEKCKVSETGVLNIAIFDLDHDKAEKYEETGADFDRRVEKYRREGLSLDAAEEKAMKEADEEYASDKIASLTQKVHRYYLRAKKFVDNPEPFLS